MRSVQEILHPDNDWSDAYPELAAVIRTFLDEHPDQSFSTTALADALWPYAKVMSDEQSRARLFRCLKALANHELAEYATGRVTKRIFGKKRQAVVWSAPSYDL